MRERIKAMVDRNHCKPGTRAQIVTIISLGKLGTIVLKVERNRSRQGMIFEKNQDHQKT